jgi:hypothetical protein
MKIANDKRNSSGIDSAEMSEMWSATEAIPHEKRRGHLYLLSMQHRQRCICLEDYGQTNVQSGMSLHRDDTSILRYQHTRQILECRFQMAES